MSPAYEPAAWPTYLSVQASASAALTGLIFVAVSINLAHIIASRPLVARTAKALLALGEVLAASSVALVPGQSVTALGTEVGGIGVVFWLLLTWMEYVGSHKNQYITWVGRAAQIVLTHGASLPFLVAGISLRMHRGGGLYWLAGAVFGSFMVSLVDAWVLLIEILR